jgi:Cyanobacterial TRADD-N associated 2-Transmembrane domain
MLGCKLKPELVAMESRSGKEERGNSIEVGTKVVGDSRVVGVEIGNLILRDSINRLGAADPANVQQIAASQLELLAGYHQIALAQSRRSFFWAIIGAGVGLLFFLSAVAFALLTSATANALIPLLSGAIVEVVAGVVFFLYGRTTDQLSRFHSRLETLQRYLLANSICESLEGEDRAKARVSLIQEISRSDADRVQKS